ncbi:putative mitochondrial protein [Andalucia godoyi]|uniref:Putative mitochondrial protein n=1 Tax=Andalucia godoyi TaxID=505711 RepID=A0A8K0AJS6_ANDGO|nr:putative mitochondrial protein [Andalucia godoyi]|eukprot:ANDGO_08797.mRNA.1 putative mitochondrial protein
MSLERRTPPVKHWIFPCGTEHHASSTKTAFRKRTSLSRMVPRWADQAADLDLSPLLQDAAHPVLLLTDDSAAAMRFWNQHHIDNHLPFFDGGHKITYEGLTTPSRSGNRAIH